MASARRPIQSKVATESLASAVDEAKIHGDDPRGSQGSDDHIVKNMADALKKSTKKRRDARRGKIEKEYRLEIEQLQTSAIANLNNISNQ
ncbi:MAG: hypothetical protein Q9225_002748 [Loekoesia sp. 1 TL-2023]